MNYEKEERCRVWFASLTKSYQTQQQGSCWVSSCRIRTIYLIRVSVIWSFISVDSKGLGPLLVQFFLYERTSGPSFGILTSFGRFFRCRFEPQIFKVLACNWSFWHLQFFSNLRTFGLNLKKKRSSFMCTLTLPKVGNFIITEFYNKLKLKVMKILSF